ncbi:hypothetical protein RCL1_005383 [Eukaryota sp. TZLM3-RCL]
MHVSTHFSVDNYFSMSASSTVLLSTPPNELNVVKRHLKTLDSEIDIPVSSILQRAEEYGHIATNDSHAVIISSFTKVGESQYLTTCGSSVATITTDLTIDSIEPADESLFNSSRSTIIQDLSPLLSTYSNEYYKNGHFTIVNLDEKPLTIVFSCGNLNSASGYSSNFFAHYTLSDDLSSISPHILPYVHLFESGNVHVTGSKPRTESFVTLSETSAQGVLNFIKKYEVDYLSSISELWEELNEKVLKSFRRKLPVFRKKIEWTNIMALRMQIPRK